MINLLVSSLMADRGLENALVAAIASELQDRSSSPSLKLGMENSVPLLQLVQQLISNSTSRKLALLKQVRPFVASNLGHYSLPSVHSYSS